MRLPRSWWMGFAFPLLAGNLFYRVALLVNYLDGERFSDAVIGWAAVAFVACASAILTRAAPPSGEFVRLARIAACGFVSDLELRMYFDNGKVRHLAIALVMAIAAIVFVFARRRGSRGMR